VAIIPARLAGQGSAQDFGRFVERQLRERAPQLLGINHPLEESALGPFAGDAASAIQVADNLKVRVISTAVDPAADMIAMWPDDSRPTHLFVCVEGGVNGVQRIDLSRPAGANATTIVTGTVSCDPIRRTPWGTIVFGEEASDGGFYEIINPTSITTPAAITNRGQGTTSDPRVVKRKAVGSLAFEGQAILPDGTMYFGDELRPGTSAGAGSPGGGIYKFVPAFPRTVDAPITDLSQSPLTVGRVFGLALSTGNDNGQGTEIGVGTWIEVSAAAVSDANGNINLRKAQLAQHFTGNYRPEDMDLDPIAFARGEVRACWTNTGRMTNGGNSVVEGAAVYGEVMCLTDTRSDLATVASGAVPQAVRFVAGNPDFNFFDNVAFQPHTGNLVVLEDGEVEVGRADGTTELRGNDLLICLPDGRDRDVMSDGCVRFASLRDTTSEPTGFIFTASGRSAFVNLQHRGIGQGALLEISGFRIGGDDDGDRRD
jgi:secreted PhoX family phosphatase